MSMIHALARSRFQKRTAEQERENEGRGSPVKTVMGGLASKPKLHDQLKGGKTIDKLTSKVPESVEDVPFRRQDRRILNARKKRIMDRKLIKCLILFGIVALLGGVALILTWVYLKDGNSAEKLVSPLLFLGIGIIIFGVVLMLCSIEICSRLIKNIKRVQDPEIDRAKNLHHVKHWIDPALIPYGWGQEDDYQDVSDVVEANLYGDKAALVSSRGGAAIRPYSSVSNGQTNVIHPSDSPHTIIDLMDESSPHMALALEMAQQHRPT
ncbi:uncharacterized protein LOC131887255 isoform X2 [Tigriopus californicus]|uniref:uncharacterized protein LOC131887255 isoform X2 n=1 Tax=Tigriopus californicus TaxID=6832 RepID=UPI0027DA658C|nr:uncharacterized protein LOC131887255 isoform X2 [Tigriopus californicus]